ncbi:M4 family metallopeptidase [Colwellia psychrerythraea]|uniref:Bacillolysin, Bacterial leucyl aminopeptidase n=1 Tax=Colwellia psychrerythraea TaxID=28229 RepID=A0A099KUB5_COLPS|nr:M4 family metallopeptidase [Colwellia psychrerythraea]KGJ93785.1 Bacillolysin, Bacterial leucyl aminopeptidase [Colwellia psychrerythraea]
MYKNYKNHKATKLSIVLAATLAASAMNVSATTVTSMNIKNQTANGIPSFVTGDLGDMTDKSAVQSLKDIITSQNEFGAQGNESFTINRQWVDQLGKSHTHFDQTINGLKVYGTSMIIHANPSVGILNNSNTTSSIYGLTGRLAHNNNSAPMSVMNNNSNKAAKKALAAAKLIGNPSGAAELAYIYLPLSEETKLAYRLEVSWDNGNNDFGRDFIYFDANSSEILTREPQVHSAKNWRTYTLNGGAASSAPGSLLCTNNQSCGGNAAAQRAHDGAAKVYDYYQSKFGRDSLDNNGMTMISSVDMGVSNAYWTGSQMIYGEASNGLNDFTADFDIIGHELTHGVTDNTARLVYANASGALNEAWSDILGLSAEAYKNGSTTSTWLLGDDLYNNQPGKAFRYMNNPTQDGYSKDWWPERIPYVSNPNNNNDQGGVHGNSGIANLAYVLLVDGGTHPRNKSVAQVPSIGMAKAEKIFYRALTTYMNQNTNFAGARTATAQAAQDLYGATEKSAVECAWGAVGVGTTEACSGDVIPGVELQNGVAKTGIAGTAKQQMFYTFEVPAGATDLSFKTSGGTGDADLFVKFGAKPSLSVQDCKSTSSGNTETCTITNIQTGTYHVMVEAWSAISGVSLTGSFTDGSNGGNEPINDTLSNISVSQGQWQHYTQVLPAGYANMTINISGGTGDADLYIRHGAQSTSTLHDCRPYLNGNVESCSFTAPAAGTWYIDIHGYQAASGVTLTLQANP